MNLNPQDKPVCDSYWVVANRLLAGEYPGAFNQEEARQKVRQFLQVGVTFFLDLTEAGELQPYASLLSQEASKLDCVVEHRRMPIRDLSTPTQLEMIHILDTIDAALANDQTVYVHCWGGIGRTGTVVGCYLVRHGMSGQKALEKIAQLRKGTPDSWKTSPETEAQRQMILNWSEKSD